MSLVYIDQIEALGACSEAVKWLRKEAHPTLGAAWTACLRGDWVLWLAGRLAGPPGDPSRIPVVLAACDCAELTLHLVAKGEERPRKAIETARAWARGEATLAEVQVAYDADADASCAAAYAATYAVYADSAAADVYAAADYAADAADAAAYIADDYANTLAQCADIVRRYFPNPPVLSAWRHQ